MKKLKELRKSKGLSQQKLAQILGVSQQSIQRYENDLTEPDFHTLKQIARIFHTSIDYLLDFDGHSSSMVCESKPEYSPSETYHLYLYRQLSQRSKVSIDNIMEDLVKK